MDKANSANSRWKRAVEKKFNKRKSLNIASNNWKYVYDTIEEHGIQGLLDTDSGGGLDYIDIAVELGANEKDLEKAAMTAAKDENYELVAKILSYDEKGTIDIDRSKLYKYPELWMYLLKTEYGISDAADDYGISSDSAGEYYDYIYGNLKVCDRILNNYKLGIETYKDTRNMLGGILYENNVDADEEDAIDINAPHQSFDVFEYLVKHGAPITYIGNPNDEDSVPVFAKAVEIWGGALELVSSERLTNYMRDKRRAIALVKGMFEHSISKPTLSYLIDNDTRENKHDSYAYKLLRKLYNTLKDKEMLEYLESKIHFKEPLDESESSSSESSSSGSSESESYSEDEGDYDYAYKERYKDSGKEDKINISLPKLKKLSPKQAYDLKEQLTKYIDEISDIAEDYIPQERAKEKLEDIYTYFNIAFGIEGVKKEDKLPKDILKRVKKMRRWFLLNCKLNDFDLIHGYYQGKHSTYVDIITTKWMKKQDLYIVSIAGNETIVHKNNKGGRYKRLKDYLKPMSIEALSNMYEHKEYNGLSYGIMEFIHVNCKDIFEQDPEVDDVHFSNFDY